MTTADAQYICLRDFGACIPQDYITIIDENRFKIADDTHATMVEWHDNEWHARAIER